MRRRLPSRKRGVMTRVLRILVVGVPTLVAPRDAHAQTADETIAYINGKIGGKETSFTAYDLRLDGVKLNGSTFSFSYTVTEDLGSGLGHQRRFYEDSIDLTKVPDFSQKATDRMMRTDETYARLECDDSYGRCVTRRRCDSVDAKGACAESSTSDEVSVSINLSPLSHAEEEKRVKKAVIYLKSLFPLKKNKEMFDK